MEADVKVVGEQQSGAKQAEQLHGTSSHADRQGAESGRFGPLSASQAKRRQRLPWIGFGFATVLSVLALGGFLFAKFTGADGSSAVIPMLAFFPMCFFYVGSALQQLQRENDALRSRLNEISADRSASPTTS